MNFLRDITALNEGGDLTELPHDVISDIQQNIRKGAQDTDQQWANALHLAQKAYDVTGVERPDPSMSAAWKQYEQNIQYAVEQLAKYQGMDGDWRMSAHVFREARQPLNRYRVKSQGNESCESYTTVAASVEDIINAFNDNNVNLYDINTTQSPKDNSTILNFSKFGVKKNFRITIEQIPV